MQQPDSAPPAVPATVVADVQPETATERILLGHISGTHGLKGWVKVHSDTSPRENIVKYPLWWLEQASQWRSIKVISGKPQGKTIVAQLENVTDPDQASALIGARIAVDRSAMPPARPGEYYWADLIGMRVRTVEDVFVGPVMRLFETGANDVLVVADERQDSERSREVLVPWLVPDVITEVDMESRVITIDWDPDF